MHAIHDLYDDSNFVLLHNMCLCHCYNLLQNANSFSSISSTSKHNFEAVLAAYTQMYLLGSSTLFLVSARAGSTLLYAKAGLL